ncbi:toxin C-terminal domain-containing protein [Streptomyces sp. NEAU-Y11]|uniref:toxin C-terminal domain-containing protein n=1 Tax=Streptomyces cucumeris TaxID=2962890 RepID=UPI0035ABD117
MLAGDAPVLVHNSNCNSLTRAHADDVAQFLGYTRTKMKSAGGASFWENKKAGGGQPRYITYDRTGHNKQASSRPRIRLGTEHMGWTYLRQERCWASSG